MWSTYVQIGLLPDSPIVGLYNAKFFLMSYLIVVFASYIALDIIARLKEEQHALSHSLWLFGGAVVMGAGIWSTHFIVMLALKLSRMNYIIYFTSLLVTYLVVAISLILCVALGLSSQKHAHRKKITGRKLAIQGEVLKLSQEKLLSILEASADGIVVLNQQYGIELCSGSICRILDYDVKALMGKNITQFISLNDTLKSSKNTLIEWFESLNKNELLEAQGIRSDGNKIPIELAISRVYFLDNRLAVCSIRDISERKKTEKLITVRHEVTRLLSNALSLSEVMTEILKTICESMGWCLALYWEVETQSDVLRCENAWSVNDKKYSKFITFSKQHSLHKNDGLPGRTWKSKLFCYILGENNYENIHGGNIQHINLTRKHQIISVGIHSGISFPILKKDSVVGVIECYSNDALEHGSRVAQLFQSMGEQIGFIVEREELHKRIAVARQAGMSEVANSVIHNIGNVLNSVNVSVSLLLENVKMSSLKKLPKAVALLHEHASDLDHFIKEDPRGKYLLDYFSKLTECLEQEKHCNQQELGLLHKNIQHILSLVLSQQAFCRASGVLELVDLSRSIDSLLELVSILFEKLHIKVLRQYDTIKPCLVDSFKLNQILVNLIDNAKDALASSQTVEKRLTIKLALIREEVVDIQVIDNGCGISPEHLPSIFSYGFTTKEKGHGFGLHSSLVAAKEMGASLFLQRSRVDKGAEFRLQFPYQPERTYVSDEIT